jgi:hypothetical protein
MPFLGDMVSAGAGVARYTIANSVRLDGSADYLSRTPGSAGNRKTWTFSCWVKRASLGTNGRIFDASFDGTNYDTLGFNTSNQLVVLSSTGGSIVAYMVTTRVFRDPTSWMHIVLKVDTPNATASERIKLYINGVQETAFTTATYPTLNYNFWINHTVVHDLGRQFDGSAYLSGYITQPIMVDGTALTPSSFGETDAATGSWKPKRPSGLTYGTNGFWLDFSNTADLGNDMSGNNNDWTLNSLSSTDAVSDTPTNNFSVLNYLNPSKSTLSNGNLTASGTTDLPTILPSSGDWYFEIGGVAKNWTPPAAFPAAAGTYNFGQRAFSNTPTAGYKTLCTDNLPTASGSTSGSFTGNASADGPVVWTGAPPATLTIDGNAVTFGTHADKTAGGFKIRTASSPYNDAATNNWTATYSTPQKPFVGSNKVPGTAQGNP